MGNTFFYKQVGAENVQISWRDIFSECRRKHTRQDLEYALAAGTSMNSATKENMLGRWQKPWVFYPLLKGGLVLIAITYLILFATIYISGITTAGMVVMTMIIPPIVMPFILMVFLWELNIPKNITIYELLVYFLIGGMLSFAVTALMYRVVGNGPGIFAASFAAFREEPAKLAATAIFMLIFSGNKKVFGLTGLVIGAAVGAGFGGFESVEYAMTFAEEDSIIGMIFNQVIRGVFALGGHVLYCAPYGAALALAAQGGKLKVSCFLDRDFLMLFAASIAVHFCWNADIGGVPKQIVLIVLLWAELLYIVKKCLKQAVLLGGPYVSSQADIHASFREPEAGYDRAKPVSGAIRVIGIAGALKGAIWDSRGDEVLHIGRGQECQFRLPPNAAGVSRKHCSIRMTAGGWVLRDEGSSYGTYLNQGKKLLPGADHVLHSGDVVYLADKENAFQVML